MKQNQFNTDASLGPTAMQHQKLTFLWTFAHHKAEEEADFGHVSDG